MARIKQQAYIHTHTHTHTHTPRIHKCVIKTEVYGTIRQYTNKQIFPCQILKTFHKQVKFK
jgi:hypothetical protein